MKTKSIQIQIAIRVASVIALAAVMALPETVSAQQLVPAATNKVPWETSAALGLTLTRGNSQTVLLTANIGTQRKTKQDEILLGLDGAYGTDHSVKNAEMLHGFGQYNWLFTERFYAGIRLDGLHDGIADIRYRATVAPLVGYYLIKSTNTSLAVEVGPAFVYQKLLSTTTDYVTLRLGERFEHKFSEHAKLWQSFEILPQVNKFKNYYVNAEIGIESPLSTHLSLRSYIQDTYYSIPAAGRLKNDVKLVTGLAYKF